MNDLIRIARIRQLNDECRADTSSYQFSSWLSLWDLADKFRISQMVKELDDSSGGSFPNDERNSGEFTYEKQKICWHIIYLSNDLKRPSPDPSDYAQTARLLIIMLAAESHPHPLCMAGERSLKVRPWSRWMQKLSMGGA